MNPVVLKVEKVSKHFKLPVEGGSSLKQTVLSWHRRRYQKLTVLKNIDFEVKRGEFFGIIGRNGSGKSTLLKIMAGIYQPSRGGVDIRGKLTPFIELGVGFNPELSGRDNIYLNGAILGLTKKQIEAKYQDIVDFAELAKFMDQKLKNYSSGMQVRLAFSIAIQAQSDILLIDEVLAVGDANFQRKCFNVFKNMKRQNKTVIFVSHDMAAVQEYCDRALLLDGGKTYFMGKTQHAILEYNGLNLKYAEKELQQLSGPGQQARYGNGKVRIRSIQTWLGGAKQSSFQPKQTIRVKISYSGNRVLPSPTVGLVFEDASKQTVFATNTKLTKTKTPAIKKGQRYTATVEVDNVFNDGTYAVSAAVSSDDRREVYARVEEAHYFQVVGRQMKHSLIHPKHKISISG